MSVIPPGTLSRTSNHPPIPHKGIRTLLDLFPLQLLTLFPCYHQFPLALPPPFPNPNPQAASSLSSAVYPSQSNPASTPAFPAPQAQIPLSAPSNHFSLGLYVVLCSFRCVL